MDICDFKIIFVNFGGICNENYDIFIHIFNSEFKLIQILEMNVKSDNYSYFKVRLSPSGKYIYFVESGESNPADQDYNSQSPGYLRIKELRKKAHCEEFYLENIYNSLDLQKNINISFYNFNYDVYGEYIRVTDKRDFIFVSKNTNGYWFNKQNGSDLIKDKHKKSEYDEKYLEDSSKQQYFNYKRRYFVLQQ